jgi:hypothetical protein
MRIIKTGLITFLCFFSILTEGNDQKKQIVEALNYLSELVAQKYQLSTTGYQSSMRDTPTNLFPDGAIVDSWTGRGFMELNVSIKKKFSHYSANISVVKNMMDWLQKNAITFANNAWIVDIRRKYFRGISVPFKTILKPLNKKK